MTPPLPDSDRCQDAQEGQGVLDYARPTAADRFRRWRHLPAALPGAFVCAAVTACTAFGAVNFSLAAVCRSEPRGVGVAGRLLLGVMAIVYAAMTVIGVRTFHKGWRAFRAAGWAGEPDGQAVTTGRPVGQPTGDVGPSRRR